MVFLHSGARDFDLGGGFHYSCSYPMVFQHSGAQDFDLGGGFHYSGSYPMVGVRLSEPRPSRRLSDGRLTGCIGSSIEAQILPAGSIGLRGNVQPAGSWGRIWAGSSILGCRAHQAAFV